MLLNVFLLLVGFVLLVKGADFFVDGSSSVAKMLGIPGFVIGLTIVAMGTSAPEAAVSISAGIAGSNEIALSNVVGSNIFNLLMVAGICAIIKPYKIESTLLKRDFPINVIGTVALFVFALIGNKLGYLNGLVLLGCIVAYIAFVVYVAIKDRDTEGEEIKTMHPALAVVCIVGGLAAVIFGGDLVVDSAVFIAKELGWSETFIGLTIIAIGTSLPELVTSVVAATKGESGLALGNVIGSNLFNIFFILGLSSVLNKIPVNIDGLINIGVLIAVTALVYVWCAVKKGMGRIAGSVCVLGYVAYTVYLLMFTI